jgi:hypothetical protein
MADWRGGRRAGKGVLRGRTFSDTAENRNLLSWMLPGYARSSFWWRYVGGKVLRWEVKQTLRCEVGSWSMEGRREIELFSWFCVAWSAFCVAWSAFWRHLKRLRLGEILTLVLGMPHEKLPVRRWIWAPAGHLLKVTLRRDLVDRSPDLPGARWCTQT